MSIKNWPREEQPREKLMHLGEQTLTDAELLAIFITSGTAKKSAIDIARDLLQEYGSLQKLVAAPPYRLLQQQGIGPAKLASIKASIELGRRFCNPAPLTGEIIDHPQKVQLFLADRLRHQASEIFACLFLDQHFRFMGYEHLFQGTINEANIYPREIVRRALEHNAVNLILAHNHPSGNPEPSLADKEVTQLIQQALRLIEVIVVDHIIIGHTTHFSFNTAGLL